MIWYVFLIYCSLFWLTPLLSGCLGLLFSRCWTNWFWCLLVLDLEPFEGRLASYFGWSLPTAGIEFMDRLFETWEAFSGMRIESTLWTALN